MTGPLISCLLPVNRDLGFLSLAIESILNQSLKDFELIVIANNSNAETLKTIRSFKDDRVTLVETEIGQLPFALNLGLHHANGRYIARMDADDISHPDRFKTQVSFMHSHPDVDILGTNFQAINENGDDINFTRNLRKEHSEIFKWLPITCPIFHPTVMTKKETLLNLKGYAYGFYSEDYDLWFRARREGCIFHNLEDKLLKYRIHPNQATNKEKRIRIRKEELSLRIREFLVTKDVFFLFGIILQSSPFQFIMRLKKRNTILKK